MYNELTNSDRKFCYPNVELNSCFYDMILHSEGCGNGHDWREDR